MAYSGVPRDSGGERMAVAPTLEETLAALSIRSTAANASFTQQNKAFECIGNVAGTLFYSSCTLIKRTSAQTHLASSRPFGYCGVDFPVDGAKYATLLQQLVDEAVAKKAKVTAEADFTDHDFRQNCQSVRASQVHGCLDGRP